jgi:hypothetical protein
VWTHISHGGLELLHEMDPVIQKAPGELLGHLDGEDLAELIRLLELARHRNDDLQPAADCCIAELGGVENARQLQSSEPPARHPHPHE